jgi:hypothetical protein
METKVIAVKDGKGEITGHITVFWTKHLGWVSIPDRMDCESCGEEIAACECKSDK